MINKELFRKEIEELFNAHLCINEVTKDMLRIWYEECKCLTDDDFITAVKRAKYSQNNPRLYDILINLPKYNKDFHKTISEYCMNTKKEKKISNFDY